MVWYSQYGHSIRYLKDTSKIVFVILRAIYADIGPYGIVESAANRDGLWICGCFIQGVRSI